MTTFALVRNGLVLSHFTTNQPASAFPDIANMLFPAPANVQDGWAFDGTTFAPYVPTAQETQAAADALVAPFKGLTLAQISAALAQGEQLCPMVHSHALQTSVSGNAGTATALQTARAINGVNFDGSANVSIPAIPQTTAFGYAAGAGGVVTQATNKATAVTLNKLSGEITLNAAALAAATIVSFTLTNSAIAATDVMVMNHVTTGTRGAYGLNAQCGAGSAVIYVRNNSAASLAEAIVIRFAVVKAATS